MSVRELAAAIFTCAGASGCPPGRLRRAIDSGRVLGHSLLQRLDLVVVTCPFGYDSHRTLQLGLLSERVVTLAREKHTKTVFTLDHARRIRSRKGNQRAIDASVNACAIRIRSQDQNPGSDPPLGKDQTRV